MPRGRLLLYLLIGLAFAAPVAAYLAYPEYTPQPLGAPVAAGSSGPAGGGYGGLPPFLEALREGGGYRGHVALHVEDVEWLRGRLLLVEAEGDGKVLVFLPGCPVGGNGPVPLPVLAEALDEGGVVYGYAYEEHGRLVIVAERVEAPGLGVVVFTRCPGGPGGWDHGPGWHGGWRRP